jgi:hypothetical protein
MAWLSLSQVLAAAPAAAKLGVSEVARGSRGFVGEYQRRAAFIARHLAQYRKNPTERRRLALLMWAFDPKA